MTGNNPMSGSFCAPQKCEIDLLLLKSHCAACCGAWPKVRGCADFLHLSLWRVENFSLQRMNRVRAAKSLARYLTSGTKRRAAFQTQSQKRRMNSHVTLLTRIILLGYSTKMAFSRS